MPKKTPIEKLEDSKLVTLALSEEIFTYDIESHSLFTNRDYLNRPVKRITEKKDKLSRQYVKILREHLAGNRIIDLGAGLCAKEHRDFFQGYFSAKEYIPIDLRTCLDGCITIDALSFLVSQEPDSSICMAYGLLNEPLLGHSLRDMRQDKNIERIRQEYALRLTKEIYRVTLPDNIFFGAGIFKKAEGYLEQAGFRNLRTFPFIFHKD